MARLKKYFELIAWISALLLLARLDPNTGDDSSLCILHYIGLQYCPGCGLGRSIAYLFRGELKLSFDTHFMGVPAAGIMLHRIFTLIRKYMQPAYVTRQTFIEK